MQLDVNGTVTREAGQFDLTRAFESRPPKGDWSITLEHRDGSYLQAFAPEGRNYQLTSRHEDVQTDGRDRLDAQAAGKVLSQYLSGDPAWRDQMDWRAPPTGKFTTALRDQFTDVSKGPEIQPSSQDVPASPASLAAGFGYLLVLALGALIAYGAVMNGPAMIVKYFPKAGDPRLPALVGGMGLFALLFGLVSLVVALRSRSWPTTSAEIISSAVEEDISSITAGGDRSYFRVLIPRIEYRYTVEGRSYTCQKIQLGMARNSAQTDAEETVARYPVRAQVVAHYDPRNPGRAFLEYSMLAPLMGFALAVVFFAFFAHLVGLY